MCEKLLNVLKHLCIYSQLGTLFFGPDLNNFIHTLLTMLSLFFLTIKVCGNDRKQ